jgi:hypothetical protein
MKMLKWVRRLFIFGTVASLLIAIIGLLSVQYLFQQPATVVWGRFVDTQLWWYEPKYPSLWPVWKLARFFGSDNPAEQFEPAGRGQLPPMPVEAAALGPVGPILDRGLTPVGYDSQGRPVPTDPRDGTFRAVRTALPNNMPIVVTSSEALSAALAAAQPGDHILIAPGKYAINVRANLPASASGSPEKPIWVRASRLGDVVLEMTSDDANGYQLEGFLVSAPYWVFENLVLRGVCQSDWGCEHAFHVVGEAQNTVIRNNVLLNFNAHLKVNRNFKTGTNPDHGLVEANFLANEHVRDVRNPVTFMDIVATDGWVVRRNVITDFAKTGGDMVTYGAFMKGGGTGGVFENNFVQCTWRLRGGVRIGLSFGGGGSLPSNETVGEVCRGGKCPFEHKGGIMRNNVIRNCPDDVGIYINRSPDTLVENNIIHDTRGIDVRFKESSAWLANNVIDGRIFARDFAVVDEASNLKSGFGAVFLSKRSPSVYANPYQGDYRFKDQGSAEEKGARLLSVPSRDMCGRNREQNSPGIGAFLANQANCDKVMRLAGPR